jgi:hypothetical protein
MKTIFVVFSAAFAGFCIWLIVRIVNRRERWAKQTGVRLIVSVAIAYPLLFGPVCWIHERQDHLDTREEIGSTIALAYRPVLAYWKSGLPGAEFVHWYAALGTSGNRLNGYSSSDLHWEQFPFSILTEGIARVARERRNGPIGPAAANPESRTDGN